MRAFLLALVAGVILVLTGCGTDAGTTNTAVAEQALPSVTKVADPSKAAEPKLTASQKNAIRTVQTYTDMTGFSRLGLIHQLVAFDKYSTADATFAVDHVKLNYNELAVRTAQNYLDFTGYSRAGLIRQMVQFDKYTEAQAKYAADKVGL